MGGQRSRYRMMYNAKLMGDLPSDEGKRNGE
jgi:hypothetical protein